MAPLLCDREIRQNLLQAALLLSSLGQRRELFVLEHALVCQHEL